MKKFYHTVVLVSDVAIKAHPFKVSIGGEEFEVAASADGHALAEMEPMESLLTEVSHMEHEDIVTDEFTKLVDEALLRSHRQRENSYDE